MAILRGWNEDEIDTDGDFLFANSDGMMSFTLPDTFITGDSFTVTAEGGVASEGDAPDDFEVILGIRPFTYSNGALANVWDGPFSGSGLSLAPGGVVVTYNPNSFSSWTTLGDQPPETKTLAATGLNFGGYTLLDSVSWPGEGISVNSLGVRPMGWYPRLDAATQTIPSGSVQLNPGDLVNLNVFTQSFSYDSDHPTRSIYPYIKALTIHAGGVDIPLNLAQTRVGFNTGEAGLAPWNIGPWNPLGLVSTTQPAQADVFQDFWLIGSSQRVQGQIF